MAVGYPLVSRHAPVWRKTDESRWHQIGRHVSPGPVVRSGSEPVSLMGTVPIAVVEKDINIDIRHIVNVAIGYDNDGRRCGRDKNGQGDVDADVYVNPRSADPSKSYGECQ